MALPDSMHGTTIEYSGETEVLQLGRGALIIRIGFWGVPYDDYSIFYPKTLF